jgi:hypothetical protein
MDSRRSTEASKVNSRVAVVELRTSVDSNGIIFRRTKKASTVQITQNAVFTCVTVVFQLSSYESVSEEE